MEQALARRLEAVGFPRREGFRAEDLAAVRDLAIWLENRVIRFHMIEDRAYLQVEGDAFSEALQQYLEHLGYTGPSWSPEAPGRGLMWLLGHAVAVLYEDQAESLGAAGTVDVNACFRELLQACKSLGAEPPASATLSDVATCVSRLRGEVESRLAEGGAASAPAAATGAAPSGKGVSEDAAALEAVDELPMNFTTEDKDVDRAARLLYVLYVEDLRRLQDQVNACIAKAQEFTANPRTNAALGKLGR